MRILLAEPRGFCAGVDMAIETLEQAIALLGTPIYVFHQIVHNRHVVERFERLGVKFVDGVDEVPAGSTLVFSAHGVSPAVRDQARARRLTVIDATCPLVLKVHAEAVRFARLGYQIVLIGHAGHDEVIGTVGEAASAVTVISAPAEVDRLPFASTEKIAYLTQTTLSVDDADAIIAALRRRYPAIQGPPSEDICYATTNRQHAVAALALEADLVIVVGSQNSSNSLRLTEIASSRGVRTHLVDDVREIDYGWFENVATVLVTAGASAPEHLVQEIVGALERRFQATVEARRTVDEQMTFALPITLRALQKS
ncbi:MAG: 4-hydroxy-3-methylbut-2-enyl diphosphate reductase [Planctomycetota bacterium]